jgi:hypothetical protein
VDKIISLGVDVALAVLLIEGALLALYRLRTGKGLSLISIALINAAGIGLLLALRASITGASSLWIALGMTIGGVAHGLDLIRRFKQES